MYQDHPTGTIPNSGTSHLYDFWNDPRDSSDGVTKIIDGTVFAIWDVVYPDTTYQISMNCLVYHVLGQRVYKWQNGLSSLAQAMLEHLFDSMPHFKSQEARQVFAKSMLQDLAFLYEVVKSDSLTYSSHLDATIGSVDVPALCASNATINSSNIAKYPPYGALA
ncbi:hypothetical protein SERLADRAFT_416133 [Serpula lacrymans var. lacrymans S7.9]|uniref:Uncharacterized protein n=1 Tax=Serpula lacrymans var. lacrymans (strain S7.9) TaxID=578457 RepID=F8NYW5_SERL9|nr:uncharacterized protein SERLADRAFT_416133 [Serpula lacrymans var. lacrymans S7.9]EGO23786.1 hypothetical protein SERLADRAFT_416133 [Serpula lacrymans var. lacrymans S7.9]